MSDRLRVYISFAEEDRQEVRKLESMIRGEGLETWFDEKDLAAGSDWRAEIKRALPSCDVFVSCLSSRSVGRAGFYDEEIHSAMTIRMKRPDFVIPARLDECPLPRVYQDASLTWVDLFDEGGIERLLRDLKRRASLTHTSARDRRQFDASNTSAKVESGEPSIRILHLSDLHFTKDDDHRQLLSILDEDLDEPVIDYLVVSGDLSDRCNEAGYACAAEFLSELQQRRSIPCANCVLVPGNHDVSRDLSSFQVSDAVQRGDDAVVALVGDLDTKMYLIRKTDSYANRFSSFARVYKIFTGGDFDLSNPAKQVSNATFPIHRLQFLGLNSAWQIDQFRPKRASIHPNALDAGLKMVRKNPGYLGIAVWHHAITGNDKIANDEFLGRLSQFGVRLCLHGDVHELRPDVVSPYSSSRIHVVGSGAFGARSNDRPESAPRMYNLIEVDGDHTRARVSTRQQPRPGMQFQAYATWSVRGERDVRSGSYEFSLDPPNRGRTIVDLSSGGTSVWQQRFLDTAVANEIPVGETREVLAMIRRKDSVGLFAMLENAAPDKIRKSWEEQAYSVTAENVRTIAFDLAFGLSRQSGTAARAQLQVELRAPGMQISDSPHSLTLGDSSDTPSIAFLIRSETPGKQTLKMRVVSAEQEIVSNLMNTSFVQHGGPGGGGVATCHLETDEAGRAIAVFAEQQFTINISEKVNIAKGSASA